MNIDGAGSTLITSNPLVVGNYGSSGVTISNGGSLFTGGASVLARETGSSTTVTISGAESIWTSAGDIAFEAGNGILNLNNGGTLRIDGDDGPGTGTLAFSAFGSNEQVLLIGGDEPGMPKAAGHFQGAAVVNHGPAFATVAFNHTDDHYVFSANVSGASMLLNAAAGTTVVTGQSDLFGAAATGGNLIVSGASASIEAMAFFGAMDGGNFGVVEGAQVAAGWLVLKGGGGSGVSLVSGTGSRVDAFIGSIGEAVEEGEKDAMPGRFSTLRIENGGVVSVLGESYLGGGSAGALTITGPGSQWIAGDGQFVAGEMTVLVGDEPVALLGQGVLTLSDGGVLRINGKGALVLSGEERSMLNIGGAPNAEALAPGRLEAVYIVSGHHGAGAVHFNHTDAAYSFSGADAVYDLNGFTASVQGISLLNNGSLVNGSIQSDDDLLLHSGRLSAVLSGNASLQKLGNGLAVIENNQAYTGTTEIHGGTLDLIGSTVSDSEVHGGTFVVNGTAGGDVLVNGGSVLVNGSVEGNVVVTNGFLGGSGSIAQNLSNGGVFAPGNSPGTLSISGNFIQTATGTLEIEIASKSDYDRLVVSGVASLDGTLSILKDDSPPRDGEKFRILTAEGGVVGKFSDVSSFFGDTLRSFDVDYRSNAVVLEYTEGSFHEFAKEENLSQNVRSLARALDRARKQDRLGKLLDPLYDTQRADLPDQLALLSPEAFAQIFQIGFATAQLQYGNLERRLSDVRDGAIGFSTNGLGLSNARGTLNYDGAPIVNTRDGLSLAGWDGKSIISRESVAPVVEQSRWGFFATGSGEWADVETTAQARGSEFSTGGFTLGADYRVSEHFVVGIAGGYAGTGSDLHNGGKIDVNSGRGSVYASVFGSGFYLNTALGGAYNSYDTRRGTIGGRANGSTSGGEFDALLGGGYDYRAGGFSFGPVASLQYTYLGLSRFTESGSDAPLHFGSQSQESMKSSLGGRVAYVWNLGGTVIKPEVRAQWQHEFLDSTASVESGFVGGGGVFTVNGPKIGRDALLLDAGVSVQFSPSCSVFAYYTGEIGRTNYSSNAVNGGFRINF